MTHTGAQRLDGWIVSFTLPPGHRLSEVEGARWRRDGRRVRLTGTTALSTGQVATVSLMGTVPRGAGPPAGITLDGIPCDLAVSRINAAPPVFGSSIGMVVLVMVTSSVKEALRPGTRRGERKPTVAIRASLEP